MHANHSSQPFMVIHRLRTNLTNFKYMYFSMCLCPPLCAMNHVIVVLFFFFTVCCSQRSAFGISGRRSVRHDMEVFKGNGSNYVFCRLSRIWRDIAVRKVKFIIDIGPLRYSQVSIQIFLCEFRGIT